MKKIFGILTLLGCLYLAFGQVVLAADEDALYKKHCAGCHGMKGEKITGGSGPIQGKNGAAIHKMLIGYKDGSFGGAQKGMMQKIVGKLSDSELNDVSKYAGTLK